MGISQADGSSEENFFTTFLTIASATCWKENLLLSWNFKNTKVIRKLEYDSLNLIITNINFWRPTKWIKWISCSQKKNELKVFAILLFSVKNSPFSRNVIFDCLEIFYFPLVHVYEVHLFFSWNLSNHVVSDKCWP